MLVYGDHAERADPRGRLVALSERMLGGPWSHDALTALFVELAGVTQGVADADFVAAGRDRQRPAEQLLLKQLTALGAALLRSWDAGCSGMDTIAALQVPDALPAAVEIRLPEGYAFYALRPEAYALAARRLRLLGPARIIGLRSIGTGLACMAAAALGAPPPVTLRPVGDPFGRTLRVSDELAAELLRGEPHYLIVDEGPGLSGSSFGCVADWLQERGVPGERIAFLPGHPNPLGPQASERHRRRWERAQRPVVSLDMPLVADIEAVVGALEAPLLDLSAGQWRPHWSTAESEWPAIDPTWERRKFLARTASGSWLVKWAGLGAIGEARLALASQIGEWLPEVAGLTGGWLVTRWHEEAVPARPTSRELTAYLERRASLPAPQAGASIDTLVAMVRRNLPALADLSPDLAGIASKPVCTDNRLAPHEWLRLPDGRLLKADALDHHKAHDLIGCQDIAWDVAGAIVELELDRRHADQLRTALGVSAESLRFHRIAYLAFRIGAHRMSAGSLGHWPEEQARHSQAAERLEARLAAVDAVEHPGHVH